MHRGKSQLYNTAGFLLYKKITFKTFKKNIVKNTINWYTFRYNKKEIGGFIMEENKKEEIEEVTEENGIQIADDVVAIIAGKAASEVSGVYSMAGGFAGGITEVFGKKNFSKGIKIDLDGSKVKVDVNIIVDYGTRIPDIAFEIQNRVKKAVEGMTGLNVQEVNVHVQGVNTDTLKTENEDTVNAEEAEKEKNN